MYHVCYFYNPWVLWFYVGMTLPYPVALVVFLFFTNKASDDYFKNKGDRYLVEDSYDKSNCSYLCLANYM